MIIESAAHLDTLKFSDTLIPVVAQHAVTGEVLMLGYANRTALEKSLEEGVLWFFSRSRNTLWRKGDTSGNVLRVSALHADCDGDAVLALVHPAGPACHTGDRSCFGGTPTLVSLADTIAQRGAAGATGYTAKLLRDGNLRLKKLGEEAVELSLACAAGDAARAAEEGADLIYHTLVACHAAGARTEVVLGVLDRRRSGSASASSEKEAVDQQQDDGSENGDAE